MKPQSWDVLDLLRHYRETGLTQQVAIREARCYRLAARISDLRADGYDIRSVLVTQQGVRFARYYLVEPPVQGEMGL